MNMTLRTLAVLPALLVGALQAAPAAAQAPADGTLPTWRIDATHSELSFRIRHLISRVRGTFGEWGGTLAVDPANLSGGSVQVSIATASIDTNNERRDNHLRTADFFDAPNHPQITFQSRRVEHQAQNLRVHGDLTIRGVTRPVVLEGRFLGSTRDAQGRERIGFEAETTINRHHFNVSWNSVADAGGVVLGDDVTISIVVGAVRQ
jgi:polyisoprenoid-binding protein YceI